VTTTSLGAQLTAAIAAQDAAAIAACFAADAEFRALTPPGLRERSGAGETAALIESWFADSSELDLVETITKELSDRVHIAYRFQGVEEGEPYAVEQHLYCSVEGGRITRADLLCSGFRPRGRSAS
jgi:ketosteroid isomerase-like protein